METDRTPRLRRRINDNVYTDPDCARRIVRYLNPTGRIADPSRGPAPGPFYDAFPIWKREWFEVTEGRNFLDCATMFDWCISNPPWSTKSFRPILRHACRLADNVAFLIRVQNVLGFTARHRDWLDQGHGLRQVLPVTWKEAGFPSEGFDLAVFHWQRGWTGDIAWRYNWQQQINRVVVNDNVAAVSRLRSA